jgi:hypothetical protein
MDQLERRCRQAEARSHRAERRSRLQGGLAIGAVTLAILISPANRTAIAQGYGVTLQQLAARLAVVESKTQFMSADAKTQSTTFTGCNLYIQNGLGATNGEPNHPDDLDSPVVNGLGNLIIGYNVGGHNNGDVRTGSHNLILGDQNNYSSFGGIVAGSSNAISAPYASVSGAKATSPTPCLPPSAAATRTPPAVSPPPSAVGNRT